MSSTCRVSRDKRALERADRAVAKGVAATLEAIRDAVAPPDAPPLGEGLVASGGIGVWLDGQQIAGDAEVPPGLETSQGISGAVGYPEPARWNEIGTSRQPARPFLLPVAERVAPGAGRIIAGTVQAETR